MSNTNLCPMCNQPLKRRGKISRAASAYSGWRKRTLTTMQETAIQPWQPAQDFEQGPGRSFEAERTRPARAQNLESDFLVPLALAGATFGIVTIGALWLAWNMRGFTWPMAITAGFIFAGGMWFALVLANRKLLWIVERVANFDLDGDGYTGQPEPPARPVALEIVHKSEADSFRQMFRFDLPAGVTEDDFREFALGVVNEHRGLAESSWTGAGKLFSKAKYNELLNTLDQAGLVRWRNPAAPAQGRELTPAGSRSLRSWLKIARTHTQPSNGASDYAFIEGVG
jgi:hypothetical protein